jgi:hypothetical protein
MEYDVKMEDSAPEKMTVKGTKKTTTMTTTTTLSAEKVKWLAEQKAASDAAYAAYRLAHPVPEMVTGSPYQAAREAWANGGGGAAFDHWTAQKD